MRVGSTGETSGEFASGKDSQAEAGHQAEDVSGKSEGHCDAGTRTRARNDTDAGCSPAGATYGGEACRSV